MKTYITPPKCLFMIILLILFTLSACSSNEETNNSSDQDTDISVQTDTNTPQDTSPPEAMLSIKNSDGEHFLCENPYPGHHLATTSNNSVITNPDALVGHHHKTTVKTDAPPQ